MNQLIRSPQKFIIWRKGIELADNIQKMTESLSCPDYLDTRSIFKKMISAIPSNITDGLSVMNTKDSRNYLYRTLNCLEELLGNLILTEQMGYLKKANTRKVKKEIIELNRLICEFINPRRLLADRRFSESGGAA